MTDKGNCQGRIALGAAFAALVSVLVRIPALTQPVGPDQGILFTIGKGITEGMVPYRDMWEMASPGIFYSLAIFIRILGAHMWTPAAVDMIVSFLSTLLVAWLGWRLWGSRAGIIAAFLFAVLSSTHSMSLTSAGTTAFGTYWILAQRETFMIPFMLGAVLLHLTILEKRRLWLLVPYGALWGMAFLYKIPAGFITFLFGIHLYATLCWSGLNWVQRIGRFALVNLLMAIGFIGIQAPFYAAVYFNGGGDAMWDATYGYVKEIYSHGHDYGLVKSFRLMFERTGRLMRDGILMWALAVGGLGLAWREKGRSLVAAGWLVATVIYVFAHREFFGYHYLVVIPPAALLAGYCADRLLNGNGRTVRERLWQCDPALCLLLLLLLANAVLYVASNYKPVTKFAKYVKAVSSFPEGSTELRHEEDRYYRFFTEWPAHDYSFTGSYTAYRYIKSNLKEGEQFFVYGGIESFMYFLSDTRPPTRFIYSWHLFRTVRKEAERAHAYRDEILEDLRQNPPRFLLVIGGIDAYADFPDHYEFISDEYIIIREFDDDRVLYERETDPLRVSAGGDS